MTSRLVGRRLGVHLAGLVVVLGLAWLYVDPEVAYFSDEGASAVQATQLSRGDGWMYEPAFADIDAEGLARPFLRGLGSPDGVAPYAKHPVYPVLLAGSHLVAGSSGFVLLSVGGTVAAAAGAAAIAGRRGHREAVAALWLTGVGSPLLFDSFIVVAHTLAAAAVVWAVWGALRLVDGASTVGRRGLGAAILGPGVALSVCLRTESILWWGSAVAVMAVWAWRDRLLRRDLLRVATLVVVAVCAARLLEVVAVGAIVDDAVAAIPDTAPTIGERIDAMWTTVVAPSRDDRAPGDLALLLGALAVAVAATGWRMGRLPLVRVGLGVGVAMIGLAAFTRSSGAVPGLVSVMPVAVFAAILLGARPRRSRLTGPLAASIGVFYLAVLATQYSQGGGVEWGWRYTAIVLPLVAVVAVETVSDALGSADRDTRRTVVGSLVIASLLLAGTAVHESARGHDATTRLSAVVEEAAGPLGEGGRSPGRPVVMGVGRLLPEILWTTVEEHDWLALDAEDVGTYGDRLADAGVTSMLLVTPDPDRDLAALVGWTAEGDAPMGGPAVWVVPVHRDG